MKFLSATLLTFMLGNAAAQTEVAFPPLDTVVADATAGYPTEGCFRLTPAQNSRKGAVWASGQIDISNPFEFETDIYVGNNDSGADGMAFVLQNNGLSTIGYGGGYQGYVGIPNAFVIEVDTWPNSGASTADHVQMWRTDGAGSPSELSSKSLLGYNIEDGFTHDLKVTWDGATMHVSIDGTERLAVPLPGGLAQYVGGSDMAYYGYTAATGGANNVHYICKRSSRSVVRGDPHFRTWSGEKFDFHGVCDLALLQSERMDIHIRTKKTRVWSYVHSAAVRIGDDILEVMGGKDENKFWLNKVRGDVSNPIALDGHPVTFKQLSAKARQFVIDLGNDGKIELRTWNAMVSVSMDGNELFKDGVGLMGTYPAGLKVARDSTTVIKDLNTFGQEWQVRSWEPKLFHDVDGPQHPTQCEIPSASQMRRRLGESLISKEEAEVACSRMSEDDFDLCVFDVMATNDKDSAGAY